MEYFISSIIIYIALKIYFKIFMFFRYKKFKENKTKIIYKNINISILSLLNNYLDYNKITNVKIKEINHSRLPFFDFSKRKKEFKINLNNFNNFIDFFKIDYILGRIWTVKIYNKNKKDYYFKQFLITILPILSSLFFLFSITFFCIIEALPINFKENGILNYIYVNHIDSLICTLAFTFSFCNLFINYYIKQKIEIEYEQDINKFFVSIFPYEISYFLQIRFLHKSNILSAYPIWFFNIINNTKYNLGPFSFIY